MNKTIITSLPDKNNIPLEIQESFNNIRKMNPTWELKVFSNEEVKEFFRTEATEYLATAQMISKGYFVAVVDLFRTIYIYKNGGVWFDAKIGFKYPLDEIISEDSDGLLLIRAGMVVGNDSMGSIATQFFAFNKNHPFLQFIIDEQVRRVLNFKHKKFNTWMTTRNQILYTTGPGVFRDILWCLDLTRFDIVYQKKAHKFIYWSVFEKNINQFWNLKYLHRKQLNIETTHLTHKIIDNNKKEF